MKIYAITEKVKPFVYLTTGKAFENLGLYLNCEAKVDDYTIWQRREIDGDSANNIIVCIEACYLDYINMSIKELRGFFPNAKIVVLSSDGIYYALKGTVQFDHPTEADLFLDGMHYTIDFYSKHGVKCDRWAWSLSDWLVDYCSKFAGPTDYDKKIYDFISVLAPHTLADINCYRHKVVKYMEEKGYKFTQGGGHGQMDPDYDKIFKAYTQSWITWGTSGHHNPELRRCCKGFRDCIAPFLNSLLIYDDETDLADFYKVGLTTPSFPFDNINILLNWCNYFKKNLHKYVQRIDDQKTLFRSITIEKQLVYLFKKHNII